MTSSEGIVHRLNAALSERYRIECEIGSGGMATVFLAEDLKHSRKVALKVLRPDLSAVVGSERFLSEIQTTANLQHPNILPLFDSGEADGLLFYVMPFVEGESLREKLDREKQLPVSEAVRIATDVAEALQAAHEQGVIHRDIKPANILLSRGKPLIADFGIALAVTAAGGGRLTETGLSLGTPYYMSPEQVSGDQDPNWASDVYSLGCVLYELLVGEPPFTGATSHAVISKALTEDLNPPSQYRKSVPRHVDAVAAKALEKLPADRFGSTGEMARALGDESFRHGRGEEDVVSKALSKALRGWKIGTLMTGAVAITSIWLLFSGVLSRSDDPPPTSRQQLNLPRAGFSYPWPGVLAVAPDGSSMIYDDSVATGEGYSQFYLKPRDAPQGTPIPGTVNGWIPVYSHDSRWIAYGVDSILMKRPVEGGAPITVAEDAAPQLGGVAWMEDGSILYARRSGVLARVREGGEESPEALADFSPQRITFLHSLPGDRGVLVSLCSWPGCETATVAVYSMQADTAWVVAENGVRAWYVPTGHLVYVDKAGVVLAVPFDLDRLEVGVGVEPLFEGVRVFASAGRADMVVGRDGTVVYVERPPDDPQTEVVWVDRRGQVEDLDPEWVGDLREPALSPDHRRIALNVGEQVWVVDLPSGQRHPLTAAAEASWRAAWSPDGSRIAFLHGYGFGDSTRIAEVSSAGVSLNDFEILLGPRFFVRVTYAPPAAGIVFGEQVFLPEENSNDMNIGFLRSADVQPEALLATRFSESSAAVSPDGLWIAYVSDRTGESEIWVSPFSEVDQIPQRVSTDGGWEPVWAHNGRELFFRDGEGYLVAAEYSADPWFTVLAMDRLFDAEPYLRAPFASGYDVDEADERFLMIRPAGSRDPNAGERMILIRHWFTELQERLGTGGRGW